MRLAELFEAEVKGSPLKPEVIENALELFKTSCKNAKWMLEKDRPIWKGFHGVQPAPEGKIAVIDTHQSKRKSQNSQNYYTEILDHSSYFEGWPKRSQSLICSLDKNYAEGYSQRSGGLYAIVPFNDAKIGSVEAVDIWGVEFQPFGVGSSIGFEDFNSWLKHLKITDTIDGLCDFAEKLANRDEDAVKGFEKAFPEAAKDTDVLDDFMGYLNGSLSPEILGFEQYDSRSVRNAMDEAEVWVSGKVLIMTDKTWDALVLQNKMSG
jgi:hypothetical protein